MNLTLRTIKELDQSNVLIAFRLNIQGKKVFQAIKYVTGKNKNDHTDYKLQSLSHDKVLITGKNGFMILNLEPLFQLI